MNRTNVFYSDSECYPLGLEEAMWKAACAADSAAFSALVADDAVMICGGGRLSGRQYAELIGSGGIAGCEITEFELLAVTETLVQVHYIARTTADSPENADLAGMFHVTSTWEKRAEDWKLIFNMDQRIYL